MGAGIIRSRELSWATESLPPPTVLKEGQTVEARILGIDRLRPRPRLELSLRQAERDPWSAIGQRYVVGRVVRGKVVSLSRAGAANKAKRATYSYACKNAKPKSYAL